MKLFLSVVLSVIYFSVNAQNLVLVDSADSKFKKQLVNLYSSRVAKQQLKFNQQLSDKKIRKEVDVLYKDFSEDFIESINKGFFVENETYQKFLEDILQQIQKNNPEYPDIANTKILLSFGTSPNAYAIGTNIVVVYIPLIKKIDNQYQLAFILSHEIAHNLLSHSYNGMIDHASMVHSSEIKKQTKEIQKQKYNKGQIASGLYRDIVYGKRKNNRKLEHQADSLGFVLFKNAFKGNEYQVLVSLETLKDIDKETDSLSVADYTKLFTTAKIPFKNQWINNDELQAYKYDRSPKFWQIDSLKTHPDCELRVGFVKKHFTVQPAEAEISEEFKALKNSSKYNHILGLYTIEEYGKSLYEALLLYKNEPENEFLKKMIYDNLIKLQEAQKSYTLNKYLDTLNPRYSNSYNTFLSFFRQLRKNELNEIINKYTL